MTTYIYELSQMAQIILYHRIVNYLIEEECFETDKALETAFEEMENASFVDNYAGGYIKVASGNENPVDIADILIPLGNGEYTDIFADVKSSDQAHDVAVTWSYLQSDCEHISYDELFEVQEYFTELANKYPTLKAEFRENGIPFLE